MVGTRTSTGCDTCRQRKKKCGEERPNCKACERGGWKCPGYMRDWRWVSENNQLAMSYREKKYLFDSSPDYVPSPALKRIHNGAASLHLHVFSINPSPQPTSAERAAGMFAFILTDSKCQSVFSPQAAGSFFPFIPSRLGHNVALDAAISCLCDIYSDVLAGRKTSAATTKTYVATLATLRACVADPILRTQSETICASIIIQIYELMLGQDTVIYNAMLQGSRALIQEAGPERFHSGFNRAMLELERAPFTAQDMSNPRHCFLSEPAWRALPRNPLDSLHPPSLSIRLRAELSDFLVEVPGLMSEANELLATPEPRDQSTLAMFAICTVDLMHRISLWYECDVLPNVCGSGLDCVSDMNHDHHREYPELLLAVLDCVTCALLNKLDDLVASLYDNSGWDNLDLSASYKYLKPYSTRQQVTRAAFLFVQAQSDVTAKQLTFGLKRLRYDLIL